MAVKTKSKSEPVFTNIRKAIGLAVDELLNEHSAAIVEHYSESETKKGTLNFACEIDVSESEPLVTTKIRFTETMTDKRVSRLDDPAQISLFKEKPEPKNKVEGEGVGEEPVASEGKAK